MIRSMMASATVGSGRVSCQFSSGNWLAMIREPLSLAFFDHVQEIVPLKISEGGKTPVIHDQ